MGTNIQNRVDLQGLQSELEAFKGSFEKWTKETIAAAEARKDEHIRKLREYQATIRGLEQQQKALQKRAEEVKQRLEAEDAEVQQLEDELALIRGEQDALPAQLAEVRAALDKETKEAEERAANVSGEEQYKQRKLDALQQGLSYYKDRLGLTFEPSQAHDVENLDVTFTQIDPKDPSRAFRFTIEVLEGDKYAVRSCEPQVDALPALTDELNATNDFSLFVRKLRKEFKALATT